mgnify:CR=1 FL=1
MTTPSQVNKALKAQGIPVEIVRDATGYYWFADDSTQIASIMSNSLRSYTTQEIVDHVKKELERINRL